MTPERLRLVTLLVASVAGCARATPSPYVAGSCPLPAGARGYPVSARSDAASVDAATLTTIARGALGSWGHKADSVRDQPRGVAQLIRFVERSEVFRRGGWRPASDDTATVTIEYVNERLRRAKLVGAEIPTPFQQKALLAVNDAVDDAQRRFVMRDTIPLALDGVPDRVTAVLRFGFEPAAGEGVARFALHERGLSINRPLSPGYPEIALRTLEIADVKLAYIVGADGRVDTTQVRIIKAPYREFVDAIKLALVYARFTPARLDCRNVPQMVVQEFRFRIRP